MIAVGTLSVSAKATNTTASEGAADLGDEIRQHRPHRGQRCQRHTEDEPDSEHEQPHHPGDGQRPADVATERVVHHPADLVGLRPSLGAEQPPEARCQVLAIDEHGHGDHRHDGHADNTTQQRSRRLLDPLVGELLGKIGDPFLGSLHEVLVADPLADQRQLLQLANGLGEPFGESLDLGDRPRSEDDDDNDGDRRHGERHPDDDHAAAQVRAGDQGIDDGVEGQGDQHPEADPGQHHRRVAQDGDDGEDREHGGDHGEQRRAVEPEARRETSEGRPLDCQRRFDAVGVLLTQR